MAVSGSLMSEVGRGVNVGLLKSTVKHIQLNINRRLHTDAESLAEKQFFSF